MYREITPSEVVRDALELIKLRYRLFFGACIFSICLSFLSKFTISLASESSLSAVFFTMLLHSFVGMAIYVCVFHQAIQTLRGSNPPLFPENFHIKFVRFILKFYLIALCIVVVCGIGLAVGSPVSSSILDAFDGPFKTIVSVLLSTIVTSLLLGLPISRLVFCLPAIAVDDDSTFKQSWNLSKGNTFQIALFVVPLAFTSTLYLHFARGQKAEGTAPFIDLATPFWMLVMIGVLWFTLACIVIWYEKLRLRYEA